MFSSKTGVLAAFRVAVEEVFTCVMVEGECLSCAELLSVNFDKLILDKLDVDGDGLIKKSTFVKTRALYL